MARRRVDPAPGPCACDGPGFDRDELREFLAADHVDVPADPLFKQRLRRRLWRMLRRGRRRRGEPPV